MRCAVFFPLVVTHALSQRVIGDSEDSVYVKVHGNLLGAAQVEGSLLYLRTAFRFSLVFFQAVNPQFMYSNSLSEFLDLLVLLSGCSVVH